jgi:hypothetical protein
MIADGDTRRCGGRRAVGWRRPATVESVAGLPRRCGLRTAVRKDRADAAEELGDEDGGLALRHRSTTARGANLRRRWTGPAPSIHYSARGESA